MLKISKNDILLRVWARSLSLIDSSLYIYRCKFYSPRINWIKDRLEILSLIKNK